MSFLTASVSSIGSRTLMCLRLTVVGSSMAPWVVETFVLLHKVVCSGCFYSCTTCGINSGLRVYPLPVSFWILYLVLLVKLVSVQVNGALLRKLLSKRISLLPTTLRTRSNEYKADLVQQFSTKAWPAFTTGQLK